jgi:hypothetical protein
MRKRGFIDANEKVRWTGSEFLWNGAAKGLRRQGNEFWVSFKEWRAPVKRIGTVALGWMSSVLYTIASRVGRLDRMTFPRRYFELQKLHENLETGAALKRRQGEGKDV